MILGSYLFLKYCFIWLSPFFLAYLIFKTMNSCANQINHFLPFKIPFLPFFLFLLFLFFLFSTFMILSLSFIRFIKVFLQTDFFNQLLFFFQEKQLPLTLESMLQSSIEKILPFLSSTLLLFPQILTFLTLSCLVAFLLLIHPTQLTPYFHELPLSFQNNIQLIHKITIQTIKSMMMSTLLMMLLTWFECFIGLKIIHEPNAFSLSLLIACFDSLPVLGVGVVLLPLALSQFFLGFTKKALGLFLIYLIVSLIKFFIEPKILSKQMGIPVFFHLLSMVLCLNLFGTIGLLYAPFLCRVSLDFMHIQQQIAHTTKKELLL